VCWSGEASAGPKTKCSVLGDTYCAFEATILSARVGDGVSASVTVPARGVGGVGVYGAACKALPLAKGLFARNVSTTGWLMLMMTRRLSFSSFNRAALRSNSFAQQALFVAVLIERLKQAGEVCAQCRKF